MKGQIINMHHYIQKMLFPAVLILLGILLIHPQPGYTKEVAAIRPVSGMQAPDITFEDTEGKTLHLSDFKGKVVVLSFWATWCAPCLMEMPMLDRLQARVVGGVTVLPIALESQGGAAASAFFEKAHITHLPIYLDTARQALRVYKIRALPMTFVINKDGNIVGQVEGAVEWDARDIQAYLEELK